MRGVRAAGYVVKKKRLLRIGGIQTFHVADRFVGHISGQVVIRFSEPWINLGMIAEKIGLPLAGLPAHEAVEILEAHPAGPLVIRTSLTIEIGRSVVVLAKPRRRIAIVPEDGANGCFVLCDDAVVAWIAGGQFRDYAKAR